MCRTDRFRACLSSRSVQKRIAELNQLRDHLREFSGRTCFALGLKVYEGWDAESGKELAKFKGQTPAKFNGNNDETFTSFDSKQWASTVKQLDQVLAEWEKAVEAADDKKVATWASTIAHIGTHNAYHVGQIIYIRKLQGSWDPNKGVK